MKKLLGIVVLSFFFSVTAYAKEIIIVCKFENGNNYGIDGTVEKFNKSTTSFPISDSIFKINENKKSLIEIKPNREKIINDVEWNEATIKWYVTPDFDSHIKFSHEINRFNGVYKYVASYDKEHYQKILRTEWFEPCSTTKKLF